MKQQVNLTMETEVNGSPKKYTKKSVSDFMANIQVIKETIRLFKYFSRASNMTVVYFQYDSGYIFVQSQRFQTHSLHFPLVVPLITAWDL